MVVDVATAWPNLAIFCLLEKATTASVTQMDECQVSTSTLARQAKGRFACVMALHGRPIKATCQSLIGHQFDGVIMGGKFERASLPYKGRREERERLQSLSRTRALKAS